MPTVSKNIFWSAITSLLQLYTGSIVYIVLAKLMPIEEFGILSFGSSLAALAVVVADFGFSLMIIKEYPEYGSDVKGYIKSGILAKGLLSILGGGAFLIYLAVFYNGQWFLVGAVYIVFSIISSFILYLQSLLKVQNRFQAFTESNIIYALAVSLAVAIYWLSPVSLVILVALLLSAKLLQLLWIIYQCRYNIDLGVKLSSNIFRVIGNSWSFGIFNILGIFYFMVDTQLISVLLGAREVALYQAVFRVVLILMVFSDILSNVLLPYLSFKFYNNEDIAPLINKLFFYLLIVGNSLFLLFTSFKVSLIQFLYTPEYLEAVALILPFGIVVIIRTFSSLLGNLLTISHRQVYRVVAVSISLIVSLCLNLLLIPRFGIIASAWTSVLVHLILFGMYLYYSKDVVRNFRIIGTSNIIVLATTTFIYFWLNVWGTAGFWSILVSGIAWCLVVFALMRSNGNWTFLRAILSEKGVG